MRISTTQIYTQSTQAFGAQQTKLAHLQEQIATGVRITKPSDDPAAAARILELQQSIELQEQYKVNINLAELRLRLEDMTLNSVENVVLRVKELAIQANNGTNDDVSRNAIADELDERYKELVSLANTVDSNGDYLFAGFQSRNEPFTQTMTGSISHVNFNGDQGLRSIQISQSRQINVDSSGSDIFMKIPSASALNESTSVTNTGNGTLAPAHVFDNSVYVPGDYQIVFTAPNTYDVVDLSGPVNIVTGATYADSQDIDFQGIRTSITGTPLPGDTFTISQGQFEDVFSIVSNLSETLRTASTDAQRTATINQSMLNVEQIFEQVLENRTSIGGRLNALETQRDDNDALIVFTKETMSVLRDTDLAEAISQLTLEQTTLDAAQAVFARITSSSLFNFLR